ncbi:MAG TPA: carotenoid oxygenase family protein, partial [Pseudonocardiaceae bacterium]|nr:carotenoid oxygenase family protein [Pseudonocardiaceae bacterium]
MSTQSPARAVSYLPGFTTLDAESADVPLPVTGALPDWLAGDLIRNGPARFEAGPQAYRHWFDGQAMLHRFAIGGGEVRYTNRYLDTPGERAAKAGRMEYGEFATDPCRSIFARYVTRFTGDAGGSGNAGVNVVPMDGGLAALTEVPIAVRFDRETLATLGVNGYQDPLGGHVTTAHPHQVPGSGDLVNYVLRFGQRSEYLVYRQRPGTMTRELVASIPARQPAYLHSFGITEDYVVLAVFPFVVNPASLLSRGKPFIENYRWRPELGTRFVVIRLSDGSVRGEYRAEPFFAFHHVNAFVEGDELVVDACSYADASVIDALYLDHLRAGDPIPKPVPTRYRMDLDGDTVRSQPLSRQALELPGIAYGSHNGRAYRYAYGVGCRNTGGDFFNQLVKLDVTERTERVWHQDGCYPGEP